MKQLHAITWVLSLCTDRRLSQAKTLADLVGASLRVGRVSLAAIGRQLLGNTAAKHRIKRTWRFCANRGIVVSDALQGVLRRLLKCRQAQRHWWQRRHRVKPLVIAFDWTDIRNFHTLMAAAVMKGRAMPLLWTTYTKWKFTK